MNNASDPNMYVYVYSLQMTAWCILFLMCRCINIYLNVFFLTKIRSETFGTSTQK